MRWPVCLSESKPPRQLEDLLTHELVGSARQLVPLLPMIKIPPLPIWLTVHREIRTSRRIRAAAGCRCRPVNRL